MKRKIIIGILAAALLTTGVMLWSSLNARPDADISVPDYYALEQFNYSGDFGEFRRDIYNWYKFVEYQNGVYLINTSYYSEETLALLRENPLYTAVPQAPFWYFAASPTYLEKIGVALDIDAYDLALSGVRLYLVPDTLSDEECETMAAYLKENALYQAETSEIQTVFTEVPEVAVIQYSPEGEYFTWPSEKGEPLTDSAPVIYVCTAANMKYFENESLMATGLDNYVKFENEAVMKKCMDNSLIEKYHLTFAPSSRLYRDGAIVENRVDAGIDKLFTNGDDATK